MAELSSKAGLWRRQAPISKTMTEQDQQIADKIISKLASADGWIWVSNSYGMGNDNLLIKAFKEIGPSPPWDYVSVRVGKRLDAGIEWRIPSELRKLIWEKAWPVFETVRVKGAEQEKLAILNSL